MVFTSISFLIYFLPASLFFYFIIPSRYRKLRNIVLLFFSLLFYFIGEPRAIKVMILSIILNYLFGYIIGRSKNEIIDKLSLFLAIILNLGILAYFKYLNFLVDNLNSALNMSLKSYNIIMPIGISFFTFQGMSYVIDVYRKKELYQKNPLNVGLYISLFPQLIAGPIVRYETVAYQINKRKENIDLAYQGIVRFIVGFSKKMLLANKFGLISNEIMELHNTGQIGLYLSWFGSLAYALQIFFDFSGYSDMAIGLGYLFGFKFEENFNYPYISKSVTEFWRRWHISLGSWFRDYVYIPLGGNRVSILKHIRNIFIVWALTGFWHGASWNFIIWGLYFAIILLFEKFFLYKVKNKIPNLIKHFYTIILILIGWVIFFNEDKLLLIKYLQNMFGFYGLGSSPKLKFYLSQYKIEFLSGVLFSTPLFKKFELAKSHSLNTIIYLSLFFLSLFSLLSSSFNPFIYFRF